MLFPTFGFLLFFLAVAAAMAMLEHRFTAKKAMLVAASYFFYAQWDWRFCFLLALSTAISYGGGLLIGCHRRRGTPAAGVGRHGGAASRDSRDFQVPRFPGAVGQRVARLLALQHEVPFLEILLPVGISFFTFHGISYVTDVYRGDVGVCRSPVDMALYMSFFPQSRRRTDRARGVFPAAIGAALDREPIAIAPALLPLILGGLFKKVVVANYLATGLVDPVFAAPTSYGGPDLLLATYGYAVQIYCDFSAYTDMAIALAALCGFRFPINNT